MILDPDKPYLLYLCAICIISITTFIFKKITEKKLIHQEFGRKILHFIAIMTCALVVYTTKSRIQIAWIFMLFSVILFFIAHQNILLPSIRKSYGIALFPLAFGLLLIVPLPLNSVLFGMITLGVSDALAGAVGSQWSKNKHVFLYEQKSWLGFLVFYCSTLIIGYFFVGLSPMLLILAFVPALSELFSFRGSDNLSVPIMSSIWFVILQENKIDGLDWLFFLGMVMLLNLVYYKKWLSVSGTTAALFLGTLIIFSSGPIYLLPIALFFIIGSLTSKLHPKSADASGRNAVQVFANGLVAVIALLFYFMSENEIFLLASIASVAISFADTLSSDLGIYFKKTTYDIITFDRVKTGLSGGISLPGTFAGMIGSAFFSWIVGLLFQLSLNDMIIVGSIGITGMFLDSIIGSLWQAKYVVQDEIIEVNTFKAYLIKGKSWVDNDCVNFLSNFILTLLLIGILYFWN